MKSYEPRSESSVQDQPASSWPHLLHKAGIDSIVLDRKSEKKSNRPSGRESWNHPQPTCSCARAYLTESTERVNAMRGSNSTSRAAATVSTLLTSSTSRSISTRNTRCLSTSSPRGCAMATPPTSNTTPKRSSTRTPLVRELWEPPPEGEKFELRADYIVGADGSGSIARIPVTGSQTGGYFREYPFAWYGILVKAPPSSEELIYSRSNDGFVLISTRGRQRAADVLPVRPADAGRRRQRRTNLGQTPGRCDGPRAGPRRNFPQRRPAPSAASWRILCGRVLCSSSEMRPTPCPRQVPRE